MATNDTRPDEQQQELQKPSLPASIASVRQSLERQAGVAWLIDWCAQVELDLRRERLATAVAQAAHDNATNAPALDDEEDER